MFTIAVEKSFIACHQLTVSRGVVEPRHCHNWHLTVSVSAEKLDEFGMVMDFCRLNDIIETVTGPLAGAQLERLEAFVGVNASAENVAKYIFEKVEPELPDGVKFEYVEVIESQGCSARYSK